MNTSSTSILFAEDDQSLGFIIKDNLELAGYQVFHCTDGEMAWKTFCQHSFQLCLLDIMLPKLDGFSLAQKIRQASENTPFLFLTARSLKEDKLQGLRLGADDYIVKPFSIEELILRVQAVLRRTGTFFSQPADQAIVRLGQYSFDFKNQVLSSENSSQKLTFRESELLYLLTQKKGTLVSRDEILETIWGENDYFKGRSMDVFISRLRKYLKNDPSIFIENIHGVGFRLSVQR